MDGNEESNPRRATAGEQSQESNPGENFRRAIQEGNPGEQSLESNVSANAYLTLPTNIGDLDGKITNLGWTSSADLHGSIPPSIGKLASLQHLNLTFSFLTGQVPVVE